MTRYNPLKGRKRELRDWRLKTTFGTRKQRAERFARLVREHGKRLAVALSRMRLDYAELDKLSGSSFQTALAVMSARETPFSNALAVQQLRCMSFDLARPGEPDRTVEFDVRPTEPGATTYRVENVRLVMPEFEPSARPDGATEFEASFTFNYDPELTTQITETARRVMREQLDAAISRAFMGEPRRDAFNWSRPLLGKSTVEPMFPIISSGDLT